MKETLSNLSEIVAKANDLFFERHKSIDTLMGIMDKTLRKQGMAADAITVDCLSIDKKIVLLLHDDKPDTVDIALGDKAGAIFSSEQQQLSEMTVERMLALMELNFIQH